MNRITKVQVNVLGNILEFASDDEGVFSVIDGHRPSASPTPRDVYRCMVEGIIEGCLTEDVLTEEVLEAIVGAADEAERAISKSDMLPNQSDPNYSEDNSSQVPQHVNPEPQPLSYHDTAGYRPGSERYSV